MIPTACRTALAGLALIASGMPALANADGQRLVDTIAAHGCELNVQTAEPIMKASGLSEKAAVAAVTALVKDGALVKAEGEAMRLAAPLCPTGKVAAADPAARLIAALKAENCTMRLSDAAAFIARHGLDVQATEAARLALVAEGKVVMGQDELKLKTEGCE